ncbi:MAG: DUF421 domain-containing protein [Janthinobacterium lividum]
MPLWERMLIGDGPWSFLIEVIWRAAALYLLLLVFMRLMGKRVAAQLTINEMAVILMLGAAIGLPIQVSSQGIIPAAVVLATTMLLQRGLSWLTSQNSRFEIAVQGDVLMVIADGRLLLDALASAQLSRELLASELRSRNVQQLGELRRVYIESSGGFSLVPFREPRPGLSLCPEEDDAYFQDARVEGYVACWRCGSVRSAECEQRAADPKHGGHDVHPDASGYGACYACHGDRWLPAVCKLSGDGAH